LTPMASCRLRSEPGGRPMPARPISRGWRTCRLGRDGNDRLAGRADHDRSSSATGADPRRIGRLVGRAVGVSVPPSQPRRSCSLE
jgi:hypothetical protein